jgi:phage-related protein
MAVVLRRMIAGRAFSVYAFGHDDGCPLFDFLERLERDDEAEHAKIMARISQTAECGPPRNVEQCRFIPELGGFELKTRGGVRVFAFYEERRLIICSHGFLKKKQKTPRAQLDRATATRTEYRQAAARGRVTVEEADGE